MSISESKLRFGDFTIFGFTRNPEFINHRISVQLGISPQIIKMGSLGQFYFYSSYGDVAQSEEVIALKLGFLRSKTKSTMNAKELLEQNVVRPRSIDTDAFAGNGLVVCLSKTEPVFSAFQTLMSVPQLYYYPSEDGIVCSDVLQCVVSLIPLCKPDESILPQHFLFRSVYGSSTYFQGVNRLIPGYSIKWEDNKTELKLLRSLDFVTQEAQYIRNDARALNLLSESLESVVGDYTTQIERNGQRLATLLSGGVDSTLIQVFINTKSSKYTLRSISYVIQVPAFEFEVEYARHASQLLHTEHTFVNYTPQDYPGLLTRVIDILAQPPNLETEPSFLSVAEFIQSANWPERYFLTGHGGDTLFGETLVRKLKGLQLLKKIPYAATLLRGLGTIFKPLPAFSHMMIRGGDMLVSENDPDSYISPVNSVDVYVLDENWDIIRRCFGDRALLKTLAFRRNLSQQFSKSQHYIDKVAFIDLLTDSWELASQRQQLFLAHHLEQANPFFDEDLLKVALTFHPDMRYIKGFKYKHLLKRLLWQKTNAPMAHLRKGPSTVNDDLTHWMLSGPLRSLIEDINRPGFMEKADFDRLIQKPDYFVWPLLTYDIFQKQIIKKQERIALVDRE